MSISAWAGTWCDNWDGSYLPIPILCDSFDTYCPAPNNNPCPAGHEEYKYRIANTWPRNSWSYHNNQDQVCGNEIFTRDDQVQLTSVYHGAIIMDGGDEAGVLGQSTRMLTTGIKARFGQEYDQVVGTDEAPLVVEFNMASGFQSAAGLDLSSGFIELALEEHALTKLEYLDLGYDPEVSPTDYIKVGGPDEKLAGCNSCWGMCKNMGATDGRAPHHMWPTICQSYEARTAGSLCPDPMNPTGPRIACPPPYCPETPIDKLHKTLAVGALAMLDPDPCHCENPVKPDNSMCGPGNTCNTSTGFCNATGGSARPCTTDADCPKEMPEYTNHTATNKHVAFFDGWKWRSLSSKIFDPVEGIPGVVGNGGNFELGDKIDHVKLTVKTSTVKIEHWSVQNKSQWIAPDLQDVNPLCDPDYARNEVRIIQITNPGSGYNDASPPAVTISDPPAYPRGIVTATATATVQGGQVVAITITDRGKGYKDGEPPTVTIAPPGGGGTQATAEVPLTGGLGGSAHYELGTYSWADNIPRKFLGSFNAIRMGNPSSCRLCSSDLVNAGGDYANCAAGSWNGTDYECTEFSQLWHAGATWCKRQSGISGCYGANIDDGSNYVTTDDLVLFGGVGTSGVGVCCKPNTDCVVTDQFTCESVLNGRFTAGVYVCDQGSCPCPIPFADADHDGDVDQDDFGAYQLCYNGSGSVPTGCGCYERNQDGKVDATDLTSFSNCFTGPNLPWSQAVTPACVP